MASWDYEGSIYFTGCVHVLQLVTAWANKSMVMAAQHSEKIKYLSIGQISLKGFTACAECHCYYDYTTELTCPGRSPCPAATACLDPLGKAFWAFHTAELKQCTCQTWQHSCAFTTPVISSVCPTSLTGRRYFKQTHTRNSCVSYQDPQQNHLFPFHSILKPSPKTAKLLNYSWPKHHWKY